MGKKRKTDDEDIERLTENIKRNYTIKNKDEYNRAFKNYIGKELTTKQKKLQEKTNKKYKEKYGYEKETTKPTKPLDKELKKISEKEEKEYRFIGITKKKGKKEQIVRARKTFITIKGKKQQRFRDSKGRFVSVFKKTIDKTKSLNT